MRITSTVCAALLGAAALVACGERNNTPPGTAPDPSSPARVPAPDASPTMPAPGTSGTAAPGMAPGTPPADQRRP